MDTTVEKSAACLAFLLRTDKSSLLPSYLLLRGTVPKVGFLLHFRRKVQVLRRKGSSKKVGGTAQEIMQNSASIIGKYLSGKKFIEVPVSLSRGA